MPLYSFSFRWVSGRVRVAVRDRVRVRVTSFAPKGYIALQLLRKKIRFFLEVSSLDIQSLGKFLTC